VVLAAAAALLLSFLGRSPAPAAPRAAALPAATSAKSPKTTFADGSVARVSDGGELLVEQASPERVVSVLAGGAAEFEVTKHPERDFIVVAGPVRVRVVGTRFRVERLGERTRVSVSQGKVEVQEADARSYLEAGESRFFPSQLPGSKEEPAQAAALGARSRFLELARGGEFRAAYQVMSQSPNAVGSGAEDLMLAADAARLSNHPEQAIVYLRRVSSEHPGDSRAPLAAFTRGRLLLSQLSRPAEAAEAFALARRLQPRGPLFEDALAREAEARAAVGGSGAARSLALQYLASFPRGKHAENMKRLSGTQ
jgi:transmembrane sensor